MPNTQSTPTDGAGYVYRQNSGTTVSGYQTILETGPAGSRAMRVLVDYAGNVGIRSATPLYPLQVGGIVAVNTSTDQAAGRFTPNRVTVSTSPVEIGRVGYGGIFVISGAQSSNQFSDVVSYAYGNAPVVLSSKTVAGSPAARTYTAGNAPPYGFNLQMASGTYDVWSIGMVN
jgi:hypothetical protein